MNKIVLSGQTISKKNSRQMGTDRSGRPRVFTSKAYQKWSRSVQSELAYHPLIGKKWKYPLVIEFQFYRNRNAKFDLNNMTQGPTDELVKAGIITDDSDAHVIPMFPLISKRLIDRENPRCEMFIWELEEYLDQH